MNCYLKTIIKYGLTFVGLIFLFNLLLFITCSFPSEYIEKNIRKSAELMLEEGFYVNKGFYAVDENIIDSVSINQIYSIDSDEPFKSYLLCRKNYKKGQTKVVLPDSKGDLVSFSEDNYDKDGNPEYDYRETITIHRKKSGDNVVSIFHPTEELLNFMDGKVSISQTYYRYYHGYMAVYRPLFLIFNVTSMRNFISIFSFALLICLIFLLNKKIGFRFSLLFFTLMITFGFYAVSQSLQQSQLLIVTMISSIILLVHIDNYNKEKMMYHLFITGCFACFIDFLTLPALSISIPLSIFYAYNLKNNNANIELEKIITVLIDIIKFGLAWSIGYVCTWISKFIILDLALGTNSIELGINQIIFRMVGEIRDYDDFLIEGIIPLFFKIILITFASCIAVCLISNKVKFSVINKKVLKKNISLILVGLIPIAWMIIIHNHSLYHFTLFAYRNFMMIVFVIFYLVTSDNKIVKD